jgi:hypothetical protein
MVRTFPRIHFLTTHLLTFILPNSYQRPSPPLITHSPASLTAFAASAGAIHIPRLSRVEIAARIDGNTPASLATNKIPRVPVTLMPRVCATRRALRSLIGLVLMTFMHPTRNVKIPFQLILMGLQSRDAPTSQFIDEIYPSHSSQISGLAGTESSNIKELHRHRHPRLTFKLTFRNMKRSGKRLMVWDTQNFHDFIVEHQKKTRKTEIETTPPKNSALS